MIDDRLKDAVGVTEEDATEKSFFALQKEGVRTAFLAHPLLGVGWGGFAKSQWSPTGHEVHSTPLRFVAETGLLGICLYVMFMALTATAAWRAFKRLRATPYGPAAYVLLAGFATLCVSYLYNRHITERTFWLLLAVLVTQDGFSLAWVRRARVSARVRATYAPTRPHSRAIRHLPLASGR
jgi:O-antigen ligase